MKTTVVKEKETAVVRKNGCAGICRTGKELNITGELVKSGINISAKIKSIEILDDRIVIYTDRQKEEGTTEKPYAISSKGEIVPSNGRRCFISPF